MQNHEQAYHAIYLDDFSINIFHYKLLQMNIIKYISVE